MTAQSDLPSDDELVAQAARDQQAFAQLYARHAGAVAACVYGKIWSKETAEDLIQDIWKRVWNRLSSYQPQPGASFRSWLMTLANNLIRDHQRCEGRRQQRVHVGPLGDQDPPADAEEVSGEEPPELTALRRCLEKLSSNQRKVVEVWLAGRSYKDAYPDPAQQKKAYQTMHRAKEALRQCIKRRLSA